MTCELNGRKVVVTGGKLEFDRTIAAYRALETLLANGRVRAIGVSNFNADHLERLLGETSVIPAVNQIELHPYFQQPDVQAADTALDTGTRGGPDPESITMETYGRPIPEA